MRMTPAVKNLLIINVLLFAATYVFQHNLGIDLEKWLALHYVSASDFGLWQLVTFLFMHGGISHIFFNMFALWMFGTLIESAMGTRRFLSYYLVCGIGSGIVQEIAMTVDIAPLIEAVDATLSDLTSANIQGFLTNHAVAFSSESSRLISEFVSSYNSTVGTNDEAAASLARTFLMSYQDMYVNSQLTVGASGAVFGILLAFGMMFPNMTIFLMFPPIPLKAKWFVIIYGLIELFGGIHGGDYDNVAHWAHIGGMIFGFVLLRIWRIRRLN